MPPRALALAAAACKGDGVGEIEKIGLAAGREERRPGDIGLGAVREECSNPKFRYLYVWAFLG